MEVDSPNFEATGTLHGGGRSPAKQSAVERTSSVKRALLSSAITAHACGEAVLVPTPSSSCFERSTWGTSSRSIYVPAHQVAVLGVRTAAKLEPQRGRFRRK